jgi:hypothetical protein
MSVWLEQLGSHWIDFREIWYLTIFWKSVKNIQGLKSDKMMGALHEDLYTHRSCWILRMWNVSDKSCRENQNIHFMFTNCFSENNAVYGIMWKHTVEQDRQQMTIQGMHFESWINKATDTYSHCFSTATGVMQFHLGVTLYIHCLYCYSYRYKCYVVVMIEKS